MTAMFGKSLRLRKTSPTFSLSPVDLAALDNANPPPETNNKTFKKVLR